MRVFYADYTDKEYLLDKKKNNIPYISKKQFQKYVEHSDEDYRIVGQTKLKSAKKDKDNTILSVSISQFDNLFRVKDYKLIHTKGYLPLKNHEYIKIVAINPLIFILLGILLIGLGIAAWLLWPKQTEEVPKNRYIEDVKTPERNTDNASTRYRFNTTMTIIKDTIQNLNFENLNKGKQLRIVIKADPKDKDPIYDSGMIPEGSVVNADVLSKSIDKGEYNTIAECYAYDKDENQLSQTNFEIKLIVK